MPSTLPAPRLFGRALAVALALLFISVAPARVAAQDDDDERRERAGFFDRAEDEEDLNRELWEYVKGTPYAGALSYVAQAQARAREARVAEAVLPTGWKIAPAGRQVELGRLPYEAVPFAGRLVVLNTGYYSREPQEVSIVNPASGSVEKTVRLNSMFPSAAEGPGGDLYVSGGFDSKVYRLDRRFNVAREYVVAGYAAGLARVDERRLAVLYLAGKDEKGAYVSGRLALLDAETGRVEAEADAGYFPYSVRHTGGKLYVAALGENSVRVFDGSLKHLTDLKVGRRPQEMCVDGRRLYVVNTDSDEVSVIDTSRDRVVAWRADFERQLKAGRVPRFNYLWLPNDHTNGADTRIRTPQQFVAQNDAAVGLLVETISRSPVWRESLILIEEDDAQNGPDHVDATRTIALAAGPHVRRGAVVNDRYDQLSVLRTVGLLLGMRPLNLNDRMAVPMFGVFDARPNLTPYDAPPPSPTLADADRARYEELRRP